MALSGRDRDGGIAMAAIFEIGPIGGLAGFAAGLFLFSRLGVVRQTASESAPDTVQPNAVQVPPQTRISRPFAAIVLLVAGGLSWWGWYEFTR
jgi:hypothetical protein